VFLGHLAVGFAVKRATPRVNLATLFAAAELPDLLWPVLVAIGVERVEIAPGITAFTPLDFVSYPWSHSLLLVVIWGLVFAMVHFLRSRNGVAAALLALLVVSHWLLDYVSHRPDMPVYPGGPRYGLGLWNSVPATIAVEGVLFVVGAWLYAQATRPRDGRGQFAFASLIGVLILAYVGNIFSAPPSVDAIWSGALVGALLLIAWAAWADRNRVPVR
jgi:FtsH-binding integral membrane protein